MLAIEQFRVQVYCDGVRDADHLATVCKSFPFVKGFTTNPSLMRKAGVEDYTTWAKDLLSATTLPISFEVLADDWPEVERQAHKIANWGPHAFVKVPIMNSRGESLAPGIRALSLGGVKVNVTAVMSLTQVTDACAALVSSSDSSLMTGIISVFAGRIADTGLDPIQHVNAAIDESKPGHAVLWASTRSVFDVQRADDCGADIITCGPEILSKLKLLGKDLDEYSRETVTQFVHDGKVAGYVL